MNIKRELKVCSGCGMLIYKAENQDIICGIGMGYDGTYYHAKYSGQVISDKARRFEGMNVPDGCRNNTYCVMSKLREL